jgi:hypothetical protein
MPRPIEYCSAHIAGSMACSVGWQSHTDDRENVAGVHSQAVAAVVSLAAGPGVPAAIGGSSPIADGAASADGECTTNTTRPHRWHARSSKRFRGCATVCGSQPNQRRGAARSGRRCSASDRSGGHSHHKPRDRRHRRPIMTMESPLKALKLKAVT